jgi:hypothetical protein
MFLGYVSIETLLAIHVISLLIERHSYTQDKHKIYFFNLSLHNVDSCHLLSLWLYEGCHIWSCFGIDSLEIMTWSNLHRIIIFLHLISKSLHVLFNRDCHLVICDSSWIAWFLGLNIHLPFSITYGSSMSRLLLALLRCMIHHGQVLVNPSSTTILSHTILHVFYKLILWKPSFYGQVASKDIQYLDVALDQFFLGQGQATSDEPS